MLQLSGANSGDDAELRLHSVGEIREIEVGTWLAGELYRALLYNTLSTAQLRPAI